MHGTITIQAERYDLRAIMSEAWARYRNDRTPAAEARRRAWATRSYVPTPMTFAEALKLSWNKARDDRAMLKDRAEIAIRSALGEVVMPSDTLEFADGLRQQIEFNRSIGR